MSALVWFRRDLRLHDNKALYQACLEEDEILPLFIIDDNILGNIKGKEMGLFAFFSALQALQENMADLGVKLVIRRGDPVNVLKELVEKFSIKKVYFNRDYTPYARMRDKYVTQVMQENGVPVKTFKDTVLHEYNEIKKDDNNPYKVYSYYRKKWVLLPKEKPLPAPDRIKNINAADSMESIDITAVEEWKQIKTAAGKLDGRLFGEKHAVQQLENFISSKLERYRDTRDYPSLEGTSKLSFALKAGTLSPRKLYQAVIESSAQLKSSAAAESIDSFVRQLIWREFYIQLLYHYPETNKRALKPEFDNIDWPNNEDLFLKWCRGETGYPIIDAAMKQLNETGWMHNRLRMITASFLTKDLLVDWRMGMNYFSQKLIDFDEAANAGGWQWCASTGTDAQPYFRIFNPTAQAGKFDPEGKFIRKYIPSLRKVPLKYIHKPWLMPKYMQHETGFQVGRDYPLPCVDHSVQRNKALHLYKSKKQG